MLPYAELTDQSVPWCPQEHEHGPVEVPVLGPCEVPYHTLAVFDWDRPLTIIDREGSLPLPCLMSCFDGTEGGVMVQCITVDPSQGCDDGRTCTLRCMKIDHALP